MTRAGSLASPAAALAFLMLLHLNPAPATGAGGHREVAAEPVTVSRHQLQRPAIGAGRLRAEITDLLPAVPVATDQLTIRGTVANVSESDVTEVSVALRLSSTPVTTRSAIPDVVVTGSSTTYGDPVPGVTQAVTDRLAPEQQATFNVQVSMEDLALGIPGAYILGVEAFGRSEAALASQDLDRTLLSWWPEETTAAPLLVSLLWPVSGRPERDAAGALLREELAVDMSTAGRLDAVVAGAQENPAASATVVLDPELVAAAADMSDGYEVRQDGAAVPGTRPAEAAAWLTRLQDLVQRDGSNAVISLYGSPDVVAARRGKVLPRVMAQRPQARQQVLTTLGVAAVSELVLVPGGAIDQTTLDALGQDAVAGVVLSDGSVPPVSPITFTSSGNVTLPTASGVVQGLLVDSGISSSLAMPMSTHAELTRARQRLLAETLVAVGELPNSQRLLVAAPEPWWSPTRSAATSAIEALTSPPWVKPLPVSDALRREPGSVVRHLAEYGSEQQAAELPEKHVREVRGQFDDLAEFSRVVTDPATLPTAALSAPTRALSGYFRDHTQVAGQLLELVSEQVGATMESIRVISSGSITVSGTSGTIPVTIENTGPVAVTVGLAFNSTPAQLFVADPVAPVRIDPGRRTSLEVTAQVASGGPIQVEISIVDSSGEPFGEPSVLVVESAAYAGAAQILVRLSLVLLVVAVALHAVRRRRRDRESAPDLEQVDA